MNNSIFEKLTRAIDGHYLVTLQDDGGARVVEPYLIYESAAGDMLLHGRQLAGAYTQKPPPKWLNRNLEDIFAVELSSDQFWRPHAGYRPRSPTFHRILYEIDVNGPRPHRSASLRSRMLRPKRRSPPTGGIIARGNRTTKRRHRS